MTSDLQYAIRQAFEPIPEVEQAILAQSDDALKIFVVVDSDEDGSIYDRLYEREGLLKAMLPDYKLRFSLIARHGRKTEDLIGHRIPVWQRSNELCHNVTNI